jgi:hypothetical protein
MLCAGAVLGVFLALLGSVGLYLLSERIWGPCSAFDLQGNDCNIVQLRLADAMIVVGALVAPLWVVIGLFAAVFAYDDIVSPWRQARASKKAGGST